MSNLRITVHLPNHAASTIYVDSEDQIAGWVKSLFAEKAIREPITAYDLFRNNVKIIAQSNFSAQGFSSGDEFHIKKTVSNTNARVAEEIEEVKEGMTFHQLAILLLDGSSSMAEIGSGGISLSDSVNRAVRDFLSFFKTSSQVINFSIAVITFDDMAKLHTAVTKLSDIDDFADYTPLTGHGGGTFIGAAFLEAEKIANQFLSQPAANNIPHDVRYIIMSDGLCLKPAETKAIVDRIKQNSRVMVCSSLFTLPAKAGSQDIHDAKSILADLASTPHLYKTSYRETDLRQFFISSMSAKRIHGNDKK